MRHDTRTDSPSDFRFGDCVDCYRQSAMKLLIVGLLFLMACGDNPPGECDNDDFVDDFSEVECASSWDCGHYIVGDKLYHGTCGHPDYQALP